jgi:hypothetical protein
LPNPEVRFLTSRNPFLARVVLGALAVLTIASLSFAAVQTRNLSDARADAERLERQVASADRRIAELQEQVAESDPFGGALEGLTDALGDAGGSGDLFGGSSLDLLGNTDLLECLGATDLFGGNLDDLLSGKGAGDLEDLLSGKGAGDLEDLLSGKGAGDLEDLLSGKGAGDLEDLLSGKGGAGPETTSKAAVKAISARVQKMRKLRFVEPVEPQILPPAAANRRLIELFTQDYTRRDAQIEGRILETLGAIPPDTDLLAMRKEALSAGVAGFYDPETGELVVKSSRGGLGPLEEVTLAHELEHALADQVLGLEEVLDEDPSPPQEDAALAGLAVVEGDASLLMQRYSLVALDMGEQLALAGDPSVLEAQEVLEQSPPYIQAELLFPYLDGLEFVCDLYLSGGWRAVDRAYAQPPTTSAQILFPELYGQRRQPERPDNPGSLPAPWDREHAGSFGAAPLLWNLQAPGGEESAGVADAEAVTRSWNGGKLHLWIDGEESAVGIALTDRDETPDLCEAVTAWLDAANAGAHEAEPRPGEALALDGERAVVVTCPGRAVRAGIAPDLDLARALVGG